MPDWAIVLVAAFGGGLAGAVLQPLASHILERVRREEGIRKSRERHLRRMIEAQIRDGRSAAFEALVAIGRAVQFGPQGLPAPQHSPLWQPDRIPDPDLRERAYRYDKIRSKLLVGARFGNDQVKAGLGELVTEIEGLEEQITARMDELNWPEVDE